MFKLRRLREFLNNFALSSSDIQILENQIKAQEEWKTTEIVVGNPYYLIKVDENQEVIDVWFPCYLYYSVNINCFLVYTEETHREKYPKPLATFNQHNYGFRYKIVSGFVND